jgi:hypothetical protein
MMAWHSTGHWEIQLKDSDDQSHTKRDRRTVNHKVRNADVINVKEEEETQHVLFTNPLDHIGYYIYHKL